MFAIAITLLVLDIGVPQVEHGLVGALLRQWPSYLAYVLSFFVIGIIWAQHHQMFARIARSTHAFIMINVLFLMWVAALPFPAALLAEGLSHADAAGRRAVVVLYTGTFLLGGLLVNLQWRYASAHGRLLAEDADRDAVGRRTRSYLIGPVAYLIALLLAFVSVEASLALFGLSALFYAVASESALHRAIARFGLMNETKEDTVQITRNSLRTNAGPPDWFTGAVFIDTIATPTAPSRLGATSVHFTPGARTAWHTHPFGQAIWVTEGVGRCQRRGGPVEVIRPGDRVFFAPGEEHWHGAAPDRFMTHIAMQEADDAGSPVTWGAHVTDEEYGQQPA